MCRRKKNVSAAAEAEVIHDRNAERGAFLGSVRTNSRAGERGRTAQPIMRLMLASAR